MVRAFIVDSLSPKVDARVPPTFPDFLLLIELIFPSWFQLRGSSRVAGEQMLPVLATAHVVPQRHQASDIYPRCLPSPRMRDRGGMWLDRPLAASVFMDGHVASPRGEVYDAFVLFWRVFPAYDRS